MTVGQRPEGGLTGRVVRGANWSALSRVYSQFAQFAVGIALARIFTPDQFGLIASIYVISNFALLFFEMGLGNALVHEREPSEQHKSTVFWVNVLGGFVFLGLLSAAAPLMADFFGQPDLRWLTPVVALSFTVSFGVVHLAMLQRQMNFKAVAVVEIVSATLSSLGALALALAGVGVVALALMPVLQSLLASILAVCAVRWRPRSFISRAAFADLWKFSAGLLGFNVVTYWGRNAAHLLVGRYLGAFELGLYSRANNLMLLPVTQVSQALGRVVFPALAAMDKDAARVKAGYIRTVTMLNALTVPALVGLAAVAPGLVPLVWGDPWAPMVPLLQVLCLAGIPQCSTSSISWLCQSQGTTKVLWHIGLIGTPIGIVAVIVGLQWGAIGVALGIAFRFWLMLPIGLHMAGRTVGMRVRDILVPNLSVMVCSLAMGAAVYALAFVPGLARTDGITVVAQLIVGVVAYVVALQLIAPRYLREIRGLVRRRAA